MTDRYLVTGGAGFIGSNLAHAIAAAGHEVVVLDDLSGGDRTNLDGAPDTVRFVEGSVLDPAALADATRGCRYVLHQAAQVSVPSSLEDPEHNHAVNATGTLRVLEAARAAGVERVVYAASCAIYGNPELLPNAETDPIAPESPYAVSKYLGELYGAVWTMTMGLDVVALRYFNVFGPRQNPRGGYAAVIPVFITRMLDGQDITIFGDGEQTRDFVFVGDVVQANLLASASARAAGHALNVGGGSRITINELVATLQALIPDSTSRVAYGPAREGEVRHSLAEVSRASDRLGFVAETTLWNGLAETVAWYRDTGRRHA